MKNFDIAIIGAGPSGSVAAALLLQQGFSVCILEKTTFPRFVIGESLLPYSMEVLKTANLAETISQEKCFQFKNGAAFSWGEQYTEFDFNEKFTPGAGTTFQVKRDKFDKILIDEVARRGAQVLFNTEVIAFADSTEKATLKIRDSHGNTSDIQAKFVLDASGYGRVLPRLLNLEKPSHLPVRSAKFTHIDDNINDPDYDRNKILITTHPILRDVWVWLIPFSDNRCSIGVVGLPQEIEGDAETVLKQTVKACPMLNRILKNANWDNEVPFREIKGYSADVTALYGEKFALLGNATEFLDPVFSSGVTIALQSALLASNVVSKKLKGQEVNFEKDFAEKLMIGVNAFRTYVLGWYDHRFQDVIYASNQNEDIRKMISAILAGYAWDLNNPMVTKSERRLNALAEICRNQ